MRRRRRSAGILTLVAAVGLSAPSLHAHGPAEPAAEYTQITLVISYLRDIHDSADTVTGADFFTADDDRRLWRSDPKFSGGRPCCDIMADELIFRGADARRIDWQYRELAP